MVVQSMLLMHSNSCVCFETPSENWLSGLVLHNLLYGPQSINVVVGKEGPFLTQLLVSYVSSHCNVIFFFFCHTLPVNEGICKLQTYTVLSNWFTTVAYALKNAQDAVPSGVPYCTLHLLLALKCHTTWLMCPVACSFLHFTFIMCSTAPLPV